MRRIAARKRLGTTALLAALSMLLPGIAVADAPPERIVDIVQVTWTGAATPRATGQDVADAVSKDVIDRWKAISGGRVVFTLGSVLPVVRTRYALPCDSAGTTTFMDAVARAAYTSAGITDISHRFLIEVSANPTGGCIWEGRGVVGKPGSTSGRLLLRDTADPMVIAHELGHNLGLGHSNLERCSTGSDGPWTACNAVEYGSATDLMGNTDRSSPLAAYHQWRMGWIPDTDVAIGNRDETVTLHSVDTVPVDTSTRTTRAIFVRDKTAAYWVEFRKADTANGIKQGLVIYRTDPPPASAVESPIASDAADPTSMDVTTDVWMINLGDWSYPASTGSPSLTPGIAFTTAFGGAVLRAQANADGTAAVTLQRSGSAEPGVPTWTDTASWRNPDAPIITSDLDDNGTDIAWFEGEVSSDSGTSVVRIARHDGTALDRTYLNPVSTPAIARVGDLPEGYYALRLRAVNVRGLAGGWSTSVQVRIDRGSPTVTSAFQVTSLTPARSVTVAWPGASDAGAGICAARLQNPDGWASYGWSSARGDTPLLTMAADAKVSGGAEVFDCVGNGVSGMLSVDNAFTSAKQVKRTGTWLARTAVAVPVALIVNIRANYGTASGGSTSLTAVETPTALATQQCKAKTVCTARITTGAGTSVILMGAGSASVSVDGKRVATVPSAPDGAPRAAYVSDGPHTVTLQGKGFTLVGVQSVRADWTYGSPVPGTARSSDATLAIAAQTALARIGFSQADFSDTQTVRPMAGGATLNDPTLDLCSASFPSDALRIARRQVVVTRSANDPYLFLSTETVRYSSSDATAQAMRELDAAANLCSSRGYAVRANGTIEPYSFRSLPTLPAGLRPASDRRLYLVQMGESATAMTFLITYQFNGDMLNAMYVSKLGTWSLTSAEVSRWLDVAAVLARRLDNAVATGGLDGVGAVGA